MSSSSHSAKPGEGRPWYRKKRCWAAGFILVVFGTVFLAALALRIHPRWFVAEGLEAAKADGKFDSSSWQGDGSLRIEKFGLGNYLRTDFVDIRFSWYDLIRYHRLQAIDVHGGQVWISKIPHSGGISGAVDEIRIFDGTILLDNLGAGMPTIPIRVGAAKPAVFENIEVGRAKKSAGLDKEQMLTIDNISITSPFDALAPVLDLKALNITFTWEQLINNEIKKLQIVGPKIYIGPDLFWFTDEFKKQQQASTTMSKPWKIDQIEIEGGQIAISAFGQPGVTLPFYFMSEGQEAKVSSLSELPLNVKIVIPPQDHSYPEYKVELKHLRGEIAFALPLTEHNADNVVPTVYFDEVSWNGIAATKAWSSLTFDRTGIYGKMGGDCNGGYLNSEFSVLFKTGFPWRGTFSASKVGAKQIADQVVGNYISLGGTLDGSLAVDGESRDIQHSTASLKFDEPGRLEIKSLDRLMDRIPSTWSVTKQDISKILIDAFRIYDYSSGEITLDYKPPDSAATLFLRGVQGARTFHVNWHQTPADPDVTLSNGAE